MSRGPKRQDSAPTVVVEDISTVAYGTIPDQKILETIAAFENIVALMRRARDDKAHCSMQLVDALEEAKLLLSVSPEDAAIVIGPISRILSEAAQLHETMTVLLVQFHDRIRRKKESIKLLHR